MLGLNLIRSSAWTELAGEILSDIKEVEEFMAKHQVPSESSKKRKKAEVAKNPLHAGIDLEKLYMRTGMKLRPAIGQHLSGLFES